MTDARRPGEGGAAVLAHDLVRIYPTGSSGVAALRGLDLEVDRGELVGIVGPSGSGTSTLLRILAGLDRPSAGGVAVFGQSLERLSARELGSYRRGTVGVVDQHYWRAISPYATARRTIGLPLALRGWTGAAREGRVSELLERLGLGDRGDALPATLSGGEQQRIAFAAALAHRPRLLLADEPTGELDERTATELLGVLGDLVREEDATCLVVTHDTLIESVADRVVHLHDGRAIAVRTEGPSGPRRRLVDASGWVAPLVADEPVAPEPVARPTMDHAAVRLEAVSRRYGRGRGSVDAVADLTADFRRGGLHVVTGPSGSGKTTLLRLITGLDRPSSGRVQTLGIDLATLDRGGLAALRATRLATMSQSPRLVPFLSAVENVELGLAIRGHEGGESERRARALVALVRVGLGESAKAHPERLSGGERARVALARAIAGDPEVLVLDEPTATLDRASARSVIALLAEVDPGVVTVVVATHDRMLIGAASDRLDMRDARRSHSI